MKTIGLDYFVTLVVAGATFLPTQVEAASTISGKWLTENGEAVIEIAPCGRFLCGTVIKVLKPKPGERSTVGTKILSQLTGSDTKWKGKILDPRSGKTYDARVTASANHTLHVEGCIVFLCKGPIWQPVP